MTLAYTVAGLGFAYSGFAALSLAMDRHYEDVFGRGQEPTPQRRTQLRWAGSLGLLLSFVASVALRGWSIGPVFWLGLLTAGALSLVLVMTYASHWVIRLSKIAAAGAVVGLLAGWVA